LNGGTALGRGIGDQLEPIQSSQKFFLVLVNPNFKVSTADVYHELNLSLTKPNSDLNLIKDALMQGDIQRLSTLLFNRLEDVVLRKFPQLGSIKEALRGFGALGALLSGSGPTLFAIAKDSEEANKINSRIRELNFQCWTALCQTV
jgi:4-diphosphocytidyl-2-C-methyl-D-erythritol kinase